MATGLVIAAVVVALVLVLAIFGGNEHDRDDE
jgi:hypothetical protein